MFPSLSCPEPGDWGVRGRWGVGEGSSQGKREVSDLGRELNIFVALA